MNAPSWTFVCFGVVSALLFNLASGQWRRWIGLLANLAFFACFASSIPAVLPYFAFLAFGYCAMQLLAGNRQSGLMPFAIGFVLLVFFWLKRYSFVPSALFLPFPYVAVGLSYVFFRVVHLMVDAGQSGSTYRVKPVDYLNYTLHFPAMISGPIQLYPDFMAQQNEEQLPLDVFTVGKAVWRIILGFFKVTILAMLLSELHNANIIALSPDLPFIQRAVLGAAIWGFYPLFLFFNFSGYTDFVIGIGLLHRMQLPENFDHPLEAENLLLFWARWHMTLSNFLKTYVFTPVLMSAIRRWSSRKAEQWLTVMAYFITFFLAGAWHGQTSKFIVFGLLHGTGVALNRLYQNWMADRLGKKEYRVLSARTWYRAICRGITYTFIGFALIWFWSDYEQIGKLIAMLSLPGILASIALVVLIAIPCLELLNRTNAALVSCPTRIAPRYIYTILASAMLTIVLLAQLLMSGPAPDIVYKNF